MHQNMHSMQQARFPQHQRLQLQICPWHRQLQVYSRLQEQLPRPHLTANPSASPSTSTAPTTTLGKATPIIDAHCALPPTTEWRTAPRNELPYIHTLYIADGFERALLEAGLNDRYPNLVHDISHSLSISNPTPLTQTTIFPNLKSVNKCPDVLDAHLEEEIALGHISGTFTVQEAEIMFGHFKNMPLGLVKKEPGSGKFCIICHGSKKDSFGVLLNIPNCLALCVGCGLICESSIYQFLPPLHYIMHNYGGQKLNGAFAAMPACDFVL